MTTPRLPCRTVTVYVFRGERAKAFVRRVVRVIDDDCQGRGPGPTPVDCLLLTGHAGVSTDDGQTIYGFQPDGGTLSNGQLMKALQLRRAFPGVVRDDTAVFTAAGQRGLTVRSVAILLPEPVFLRFQAALDDERQTSQYSYGFPNGDGDCNCITWLERLGLPLLTGTVGEFDALAGVAGNSRRRFGPCT